MLIGMIRPVETREREVIGEGIDALRAQLEAPPGWELTEMHPEPQKGTTEFRAVGKFARRDGLTEIEAGDTDALRAKVPEGYELLSIRRV
jgi:hypothetical protein